MPLVSQKSSGSITTSVAFGLLTIPAALLVGLLSQAVLRPSIPPDESAVVAATPQPARFTREYVVELARQLAAAPPRPRGEITPGLEKLNYEEYRDIEPRIDQIWADDRTPFRIDVLPAGAVYTAPVSVSVVENGVVRELTPAPDRFLLRDLVPDTLRGKALSLSGFRVRTHLNSPSKWDEFLVFQGASYFRAVAKGQLYGLSARALALHTGDPEGEEFPAFTQFWIEKSSPADPAIVIHALLESASVTGAYRFVVTPGRETVMDVHYTLFPRVDLKSVGIAPLTSMFLFDDSNHQRFDDFRHEVHDSDGLLFVSRQGEQVWRHLSNPRTLQLASFTTEEPRAFGLMQRANKLADFQDFEAHYEQRPGAWVEFTDLEGTPGSLRLVEIPTLNEANDNIVAFWQPRDVLLAGHPFEGSYRLHWTAAPKLDQPLGRFVATRLGQSMDGRRRLFVLDLEGAGTVADGLALDVTTSTGETLHPTLQVNPLIHGLRATFEFDPQGAAMSELRAVVCKDDKPVSETWLYRWTS